MCTGSVQMYLFQTFMLSHLTGLLINIGLPDVHVNLQLFTFNSFIFFVIPRGQGRLTRGQG